MHAVMGMWVAMRKRYEQEKEKGGEKKDRIKKRERKKWVMTQWHQQSPVPTLKLLPSPHPLLAKLCPSPWAGHNLARRGGGEGDGGGLYCFKKKTSSKIAFPKMARVSPCHGL